MRSPVFRDKNDILLRGFALDGHARVVVVDTSSLSETLRTQHDAGPVGAVALARLATATLMLSATLKERQQVGIQINGDGPLGELYAIADHTGRVRATVSNPRAVVPFKSSDDIPLPKGIGMGRLTVIRRLSEAPPYRGVVPLVDGGIAADLAEYFVSSEQTPTAVFIGEYLSGNGIQAAGGLFVQALPGCDEAALEKVIGRMESLPSIGQLLKEGVRPSDLVDRIFDNFEPLSKNAIKTECGCTREHFARRLVALGDASLKSLIDEGEVVTVECHFCRSEYAFQPDEVSALLYGARLYFSDVKNPTLKSSASKGVDDDHES